jgi:hypothetical protein
MAGAAARHVLMIEPVQFRFNRETEATNVFQAPALPGEADRLSDLAVLQHRALRDLLVTHDVAVTVTRSRPESPDGPFCNNWFSTHPEGSGQAPTLVLYPLLAPNRRRERRDDLITLLRQGYPSVVDLSPEERRGRFLESTGSLVLDHDARVAYAAISPRTDPDVAADWARALGFELVTFRATDSSGVPYYHTNVVMFLGHGVAGVCLEAIGSAAERHAVEAALRAGGHEVLPLTQAQVGEFCGNCLALSTSAGDPLFVMSTRARNGFRETELALLRRHATVVDTDLSAFEHLGGGSARCLIGELF